MPTYENHLDKASGSKQSPCSQTLATIVGNLIFRAAKVIIFFVLC